MDAAIEGVLAGHGRLILLAGEPGIGKSELARLAAAHAASRGVPVHWGFCWEAGGAPAYWPWTQALQSLAGALRKDSARRLGSRLRELFAPDARGPGHGGVGHLVADQALFQFMNAVRSLLAEATREQPCLLILEDLHAADAGSLDLLSFIAPQVKTMPLALIGTFRDAEAGADGDTASLWKAAREATLLRPGRLDEMQVLEYLETAAPDLADRENARLLYQTTEGNPLFLVELVNLLVSAGGPAGGAMRLPDSIYQVIRQQLSRLPVATRDLLGKAAVLGREFEGGQLARFAGVDFESVAEALRAPGSQAFLRQVGEDSYRFAHVLYRDVLHEDLPKSRREALHEQRAGQLRNVPQPGRLAPWSEIATHLQQAGTAKRREAIAAWQEAARQATRRLAFVDACACLRKAVDIFGQGPVAEPTEKCSLLLDLAEAELRAGNIGPGRDHCREAYRIAETLGDSPLMARAALVYGSAFVAGQVDPELVGLLERALATLPGRDVETRSRVQARLAAALQPAPDPEVPMAMAREAITLARESGAETVLFESLRSAISALMDFAPAAERLALNREYVELAERRGDLPEQFRGHMRLLVDACESADPAAFDDAIASCDAIAERIDLPHYRWKVESAKAMRDLLQGRLKDARHHMDRAAELGRDAADDSERRIHSAQQFSGCRMWMACNLNKTRELVSAMRTTYAGLREMRYFYRPHEALALLECGSETLARQVLDDSFLDELMTAGDQSCLATFAELALRAGQTDLAPRLYDRLSPSAGSCAHWGLLGMTWDGPMDRVLALLAAAIGRKVEARAHFEDALRITRRMAALPFTALILRQYAEFLDQSGNAAEAEEFYRQSREIAAELGLERLTAADSPAPAPGRAPPATDPAAFTLRPEGEVWKFGFGGHASTVKNSKGVRILAHLVAHPGREFHVLELNSLDAAPTPESGDAGPLLDDEARRQYRRRLDFLAEKLEQAEELGDSEAADRARGEMEALGRELSRAFGLGGRERRASSAAERARVNVQRRVRDAIRRISELDPEAAKFLDYSINTGIYCKFDPS